MVIEALRMCVANAESSTRLDAVVKASMVFVLVVGQDALEQRRQSSASD